MGSGALHVHIIVHAIAETPHTHWTDDLAVLKHQLRTFDMPAGRSCDDCLREEALKSSTQPDFLDPRNNISRDDYKNHRIFLITLSPTQLRGIQPTQLLA